MMNYVLRPNPVRDKSYAFAVEIVIFCEKLNQKRAYVLAKQLMKSGTSIGANVREAMQAQSRKDFISKLSISLKEANETGFWLCLIRDAHVMPEEQIQPFLEKANELTAILTAIIKSSKK